MKPTFVALPNLTSQSTFHECSRGTPCQPQASLHKHLTKPVVIISYSIHLERKITLRLTSITRWNTTMESTQKKLIYSTSKDLPSWYPLFQLPYQIDVKVTCTGVHVYIEIIYIDSSPNPSIFAPYVYRDPSDEFIRRLYGYPSEENYISDY